MSFLDSLKKVFSANPKDDPKYVAAEKAAEPENEHVGLKFIDPAEFDQQPKGGDT